MKQTVLKSVSKINRKKLIHAKKSDITRNKFENVDGSINTQHLLISMLLPPAKRMSWARLFKRVFNIDISICPKCRDQIRIIAAIEDPKVIKKISEHMDLPSTAPRPMSARGLPVSDQSDIFAQQFFEE